jgi:hypothetical protein
MIGEIENRNRLDIAGIAQDARKLLALAFAIRCEQQAPRRLRGVRWVSTPQM